MAKKLKFSLILKDDYQVRTLDELREYFDLEKVLNYYRTGRLLVWLEDRYYQNESTKLRTLDESKDDFIQCLCDTLGVLYTDTEEINFEKLVSKQKRIERLKQYTSETDILTNVDLVAFDQEELAYLLDEGYNTVYLCESQFRIPLSVHNKHYIGVGRVKAIVNVDPTYDFKISNIKFTNVDLVDLAGNPLMMISIKEAEALYYGAQFQEAAPLLEKLVEIGNNKARCILGEMYMYWKNSNFPYDFNKGYSFICDGANEGDTLCLFWQAIHTTDGFKNIYDRLLPLLKEEVKSGDALALYSLASYYEQEGANKNLELATKYYQDSAKAGYWRANRDLGWNYKWGRGVPIDYYKAKEYYLKLEGIGDTWVQIRLGELLYYNLDCKEEGLEWYRKGYTPETLRNDIQKVVEKIDGLEKKCIWSYLGYRMGSGEYSTKSEAIRDLKNTIIKDCNSINENFSKEAFKAVEQYIEDIQVILKSVKLYMSICEQTDLVEDKEIDIIFSSIREYGSRIIPSYTLDYNSCTYSIDSENALFDNGFSFVEKRYTFLFDGQSIFGQKYGMDQQAMIDNYSRDLYIYVKQLLQPIKQKLLLLNTEVIA